ncbi:uncharacterized protein [Rutidosis leptorrhynchoides]|uniref:uncharacterized protein n=1 Tax=Rutidosis leptorrhynchoides TaxID=125765 RepID=UPI003A99FB80
MNSIIIPNLKNVDDQILWICNNGTKVQYSTKQVWRDLRPIVDTKRWYHVVWFTHMIPKHAFIFWLAIWDGLSTKVRVQKWNPMVDDKCCLCDQVSESVEHLFFRCDYSKVLWERMKSKLLFKGLTDKLQEMVETLSNYPYKNQIWNIINRLVIAAAVYFVWQERNLRILQGKKRNVQDLVEYAQSYIRVKMLTFKVNNSAAVAKAEEIWGVQFKRK